MAGALRKTMVYLGLAEDDDRYDDVYDEYEDETPARRDGRYDQPHGASAANVVREQGRDHIREQGAQVTHMPQRPVARVVPYSTPDPRVFLCSASTPPSGGVHGMCGHFSALAALATFGD